MLFAFFSVHIYMYVKCSKFLFLLSIKMLVFRTRAHKIVRIANRKDPDKTASFESDLGLHCLSRLFR